MTLRLLPLPLQSRPEQDQSGDLDHAEVETLLAAMGLQGRLRIGNPTSSGLTCWTSAGR